MLVGDIFLNSANQIKNIQFSSDHFDVKKWPGARKQNMTAKGRIVKKTDLKKS